MIAVFTGGTGGTKLVQGLQQIAPPEDLTVVVNTGDDIEWWGLHVSPDIDSVLYGLSGLLSRERGWGMEDESFRCLDRMRQLGQPAWFSLGDLDLATHLTRTMLLREGKSLSAATAELAAKLGIRARVLPMTDDRVSTVLDTAKGALTLQEYFVRERHQVDVRAVYFQGAEKARAAQGVIEAIGSAEAVIFAPQLGQAGRSARRRTMEPENPPMAPTGALGCHDGNTHPPSFRPRADCPRPNRPAPPPRGRRSARVGREH